MKKTLFFATTGLLLSIGASTLTAQAVELPQSVNSKGTVSFKASENQIRQSIQKIRIQKTQLIQNNH